jgi:serine/threonine-protein kinase HipA
MGELWVYIGDDRAGSLTRTRAGRVQLEYTREWQSNGSACPLSLSMPLAARHHPPRTVEPYLWGLLPGNEVVLQRWAQRFSVSARSVFSLLAHVGADCPGAVRVLQPELAEGDGAGTGIAPLGEEDIAARLRMLRSDVSAWRVPTDAGQFSLAGAQPKTALWFDGQQWGVPRGSTPTTHILKPGVIGLDGSAQNEHFCLAVARELGLPVASSCVVRFEDEVAIVVERYDRVRTQHGVVRVHQEDVCQALSIHPTRKYQNEGGPGADAVAQLLRESSFRAKEDVESFVAALAFNWLVGGTDAHAKNYSLLIAVGGRARFAPLYDLASALPYPEMSQPKLKLAMKLGGKYRLRDVGRHEWQKLATELSLDPGSVLSTLRDLAEALPDASAAVLRDARGQGLEHPILHRLHSAFSARAAHCRSILEE